MCHAAGYNRPANCGCGWRAGVCLMALFVCGAPVQAAEPPVEPAALVRSIGSNAVQAVVLTRVAARAVANAQALRNDAETALVEALVGGDGEAVQAAKALLKQRARDAREVLETLEEAARAAAALQARELAAAALVKELAEEARRRRVKAARKSLAALEDSSRDELRELDALVEALKRRWLVSALGDRANGGGAAPEAQP
jgi:hypothetical protein